jgi:hypothetical protein
MANQQKESIVNKLIAFVTDKKKLPLLLMLLGGGATVVTGTVLLANPGNGGSTGNTTSQPGGSVVPFSGNDVPEWDFDNATLDGNATTVGVGYDYNWYSRFQNQYYYQSGRNLIEGAPTTGNINVERYTEMGISIYNMRTTEVEFYYEFELSEERKTYLLGEGNINYNYNWIRIAYDQDETVLVLLTLRLPVGDEPALGGSYTPIETYLNANFTIDQEENWREYTLLLKFDINDDTQFTILDAYERQNNVVEIDDLLIEGDTLYFGVKVWKNTIDNRANFINSSGKLDMIDIPESYPTFTNYSTNAFNVSFSYLMEFDISNYQAIDHVRSIPITFDGYSNLWFYGFREGFETKYFNENGEITLGMYNYINAQTENAIITAIADTESNVISAEEKARLFPSIEDKIIDFYNRNVAYNLNYSLSLNYTVLGFYNFETGLMTKNTFNVYSWQSVTIENVRYQFNNNYSATVIGMADGDTAFIVENDISVLYPEQQINNYGWSSFNPDYRVYTYNAISKVDLVTNEVTLIEENEDNGKYIYISGIYQKSGGYYVSGTYYESESTPEVQSTDAFLLEVDEDFNTINELVLAGSRDDNGSQITLNSQGRPVWLVQSNSTDGDFAAAGASNTEGRFKVYSVTF